MLQDEVSDPGRFDKWIKYPLDKPLSSTWCGLFCQHNIHWIVIYLVEKCYPVFEQLGHGDYCKTLMWILSGFLFYV